MKLYYSPGGCALSVHITLCELGIRHELEAVDLKTHTYGNGADYYQVNPKGYVPALQLDDGQVLTEVPAILQFLADNKTEAGLLQDPGTVERAKTVGWLTFVGTEMHRNFTPFFRPQTSDDWKTAARSMLEVRLNYLNNELQGRDFVAGADFSIADPYLFTILTWTDHIGLDLAKWPHVAAYRQRVAARPAVQDAMKAQGLLK